MATLIMSESTTAAVEAKADKTVAPRTGGLSLVRGMLLMIVTTGVCEIVLIGAHTVMARVLGH